MCPLDRRECAGKQGDAASWWSTRLACCFRRPAGNTGRRDEAGRVCRSGMPPERVADRGLHFGESALFQRRGAEKKWEFRREMGGQSLRVPPTFPLRLRVPTRLPIHALGGLRCRRQTPVLRVSAASGRRQHASRVLHPRCAPPPLLNSPKRRRNHIFRDHFAQSFFDFSHSATSVRNARAAGEVQASAQTITSSIA